MALFGGKRASDELRRGRLVARALTGSWRATPPAPDLSAEEWSETSSYLLQGGCAGLGWRQHTRAGLPPSRTSFELQVGFKQHERWCLDLEKQIEGIFELLRAAGVEPLLSKGWAVARLYPERGLRPYGDIDLCLHPEELGKAEEALRQGGTSFAVDLHPGFVELPDRSHQELLERSRLVWLGETEIRILGAEDLLRHHCLHLLKHGAYRPLWFCDLGAILESLPAEFEWAHCLKGDRWRGDWTACALALGRELVGAGEATLPERTRDGRQPKGLAPTVLRQWGKSLRPAPPVPRDFFRQPGEAMAAAAGQWPNPIEAKVRLGRGPTTRLPVVLLRSSWYLYKVFERLRR